MNYLSAENISKNYNERWLFRGINFGILKGDKVALFGQNGTGKTTLMNILAGIIPTEMPLRIETVPSSAGIMPAKIFIKVVLPVPFCPTKATLSPLRIPKLIPRNNHRSL